MWMNRERDIFGQRTHFDCEYAFCNQFSGACAHDTYPQHALTLRINNELGHAFRSVDGHRSSRGGPGEFRDFKLAILFLRFRLSEATPRDFRIGKNNRGNGTWLKCNFVTCDRFDCGTPFMRSLVRQHGLPGHVADGVDHRIIRLQLLIYLDEPAWADPRLSFFKPRNLGVRFASYGDQNLVDNSFALLDLRPIEGDANSARFFLYRSDRSVQEDGFEALFHALVQRKNEIAVRAGQQSRKHFNYRYLAAESRINRAEFQADVAAADHEQSFGHFCQVQRSGGIHHARSIEFESGNDGRPRSCSQNDAVERKVLFGAVRLAHS